MSNKIISYEKSFASHDKSKYWSDKNELKPDDILLNNRNKYWFNCDCGHEFYQALNTTIKGAWCPYCSRHKICGKCECIKCFNKSFASHEKSKFWSDKNDLKPIQVPIKTNTKYYFNCDICNHIMQMSPNCILKGSWCNYCNNGELCNNDDCVFCFNKSFASHEKSKYWDDNKLTPRQVFKVSSKKYLFKCNICYHIFEISTANVSNNYWCCFCANKKLCDDDNCNLCLQKSFSLDEKSKYWNYDINKKTPRQVSKGSDNKYWFICNLCNNNFEMCIGNITRKNTWCPFCINKTEHKLFSKLIINYPYLKQQFKSDWCKNKTYLPFDFVLEELKIIIELDGIQHFKQVSNWEKPEKTQENDKYKMLCANNNGFSVIRILQEDVLYDNYNWLEELIENIKNIILVNKIQNIFMCKNNEYDIYD
jgi:very-short-patch-repair endonuclease